MVFNTTVESKINNFGFEWTIKQNKNYEFKTLADMNNKRPSRIVIKTLDNNNVVNETSQEYTYHNNGKVATKEEQVKSHMKIWGKMM